MSGHSLHVDCGSCAARGPACPDCVISVLLGAPPAGLDLDTEEQAALSALADSGLVPPLRLVPRFAGPPPPNSDPMARDGVGGSGSGGWPAAGWR